MLQSGEMKVVRTGWFLQACLSGVACPVDTRAPLARVNGVRVHHPRPIDTGQWGTVSVRAPLTCFNGAWP